MPVRFQVDSDFYDHPKTIDASDAAVALWTRAGAYSTHKLLDGFVPDGALALLSKTPDEAARELVRHGLWRRVKSGYQFHQWEVRNLTRERIEADRAWDRERKRSERGHTSPGRDVTCSGCGVTFVTRRSDTKYCSPRCRKKASRESEAQVETQNVQPESGPESERNPNGFHLLSVSVSGSVSGSGHAASGSPEPPSRCSEHLTIKSDGPCGPCGEARRDHESWQADKRARLAAAPRCQVDPSHRGQPADNCANCRSDQLALTGRTGAFRIVPAGAA